LTGTPNIASGELSTLILVIIPILFLIVIYFMAVSLWNTRTALHGIAAGVIVFGLVTSLGSGWDASVTNATNPLEPFHMQATNADVFLLRETL
jgi:hypothetical protein